MRDRGRQPDPAPGARGRSAPGPDSRRPQRDDPHHLSLPRSPRSQRHFQAAPALSGAATGRPLLAVGGALGALQAIPLKILP